MPKSAAAVPARARRKTATSAAPRTRRTVKPAETPVTPEIPAESVATVAVAAVTYPSHQEIAALAYNYWEARGYQGGSPEEDWLRAERELNSR